VSILTFRLSICFLICFCVDMGASTHPSMPALTTGTTVGDSNSAMGWNNTTWGQVDPPNWPSPTSSWGVPMAQPQADRWASSTSPQMEYARGLGWGVTVSVCFDFDQFDFNLIFFLACSSCRSYIASYHYERDSFQ
jgi:hypothetical protein